MNYFSKNRLMILCIVVAISALALLMPRPTTTVGTAAAATESPDAEYKRVGYFVQWGMYARKYWVKDVVTTGSAAKLTHINYAFANVSTDSRCYEETRYGWGDASADYQLNYSDALSVDGVGDEPGLRLKGHFNQIKKLKAMYPHLKVLLSIGGYSWSGRFSDAAMPGKREAFVKSCIDLFIRGNLPIMAMLNGGTPTSADDGQAAGVFDGIDVDWEYPAAPGFEGDPERNLPANVYRPEDTQNFTALLAEFRRQLDAVGKEKNTHYLLTIAVPAGADKYNKMEIDKITPIVDWMNLMAFDIHGTWDEKGPTNFNAALFSSPNDPAEAPYNISVDSVVTDYLSKGVPPKKLVLGLPFYGRGWTGVPDQDHGLYQKADTMAPAPARFENGVEDAKVLAKLGYPAYHDPITKAMWIFDGKTWWNYDDPEVIAAKMAYIKEKQLGGAMFWSLDSDDGTLIDAVDKGLK